MQATTIAIEALSKLDKTKVDNEGNYLHMQISLSDDNRVYIVCVPLLHDYVMIHEEYDLDSTNDDTHIMTKARAAEYIQRLPSITWVGLRVSCNHDDALLELYKL